MLYAYLLTVVIYILILKLEAEDITEFTVADCIIQIILVILAPIGILMYLYFFILHRINWDYKPFQKDK